MEVDGISKHHWQCVLLSLIWGSMQVVWCIQIAFTTPTLVHLGVTKSVLGVVWLAGPLSGIFVQPIVGAASDCCRSPWGRRRPFIAGGGLVACCTLVLFSFAEDIGSFFGDSGETHPVGACIAIVAFWIQDCALNTIQGPCRALVADVLPAEYHAAANWSISFSTGSAYWIAYGSGALDLRGLLGIFRTQLQGMYAVALFGMMVLGIVPLVLLAEEPGKGDALAPVKSWRPTDICGEVATSFRAMPPELMPIFHIQFWSFFAWFSFKLPVSDWVAEDVFDGDAIALEGPGHERFEAGLRYASLCLMVMSLVFLLGSAALGFISKFVGIMRLWQCCVLAAVLCFLIMVTTTTKGLAMLAIGLIGIFFAGAFSIPWTIVSKAVRDDEETRGRVTAGFNLSQCFPSIVVSLVSGPVVALSGESVAAIFYLGLLGSLAAFTLLGRTVGDDKYQRFEDTPGDAHVDAVSFGNPGTVELDGLDHGESEASSIAV
mmetsp:Transcript_124302/g.284818  ORF Transcript_124302/g.284818 Transcript_124302/m.284818 type:complete len:488 (+) Transcript_124302:43-1506(+)